MCSLCSATQAVKCGVASSSPSSLASVSLSGPSCTILLFHFVVLILLVVILYQFIQLFTRSHFSHKFSLYFDGILSVVSTLPVSSKRSNCNKASESCLEEVSQLLVYQVALINQYWLRLHGDFRRNKESTMILASSTKTKNSFVSIVGFVELILLLSIATR